MNARTLGGGSQPYQVVGIDGCRAGWVAVTLRTGMAPEVTVFDHIADLWDHCNQADLCLVDMPIGLMEEGADERLCDPAARRMVGPRAPSVFRPPCRAALKASTYTEACAINAARTGKRLARQTWNIMPRIRELDAFLQTHPEAHARIRECHPEVAFSALAGEPMRRNKRTDEGFTDRLAVLEIYQPGSVALVDDVVLHHPRNVLTRDDVVDALVLAITARPASQPLMSLPEAPIQDATGLQMAIVYRPGLV